MKKVYRVNKFIQKVRVKPYIDMNTNLRQKAKNYFDFSKFLNNAVFAKTMKDVKKHKNIKLVTTERRKNI